MSLSVQNQKPLSTAECAAFCSQLSLILKAGISVTEGLSIMAEDSENADEKALLSALLEDCESTGTLYTALENSGLYPPYMIRMVRLGEETGSLDDVCASLSDYYNREDFIRSSIKSAVTYPLMISVMMIAVILILIIKVLPIFSQVYRQLGSELTGFSAVLLKISETLQTRALAVIIALLIVAVLIFVLCRTEKGHNILSHISTKLNFSRKLKEKRALCRFAGALSLTLRSGLTIDQAMEMAASLNEDALFGQKLSDAKKLLDEGEDLSPALLRSGILSGMYARMAAIGGKTGTLDQVMSDISDLCQQEIDETMSRRLAVLEPTLVIVLSLIVGIILLSVMLPLMGIMSGI